MKAMYKFEVAEAAGVSRKTLLSWIRERVQSGDEAFENYNVNCKLLTPVQLKSLSVRYCIIFEKPTI
ncbi:MAG: hypothetical protein J6Y55_06510 [Bacteroidales bacterium]|nr:hypothetical protein [Bacteroidales bacterium]